MFSAARRKDEGFDVLGVRILGGDDVARHHHVIKPFKGADVRKGYLRHPSAPPEDVRARIERVFDHDGPGFKSGFLDEKDFEPVRGLIHRTVPEESVVGMLMDTPIEPHVVQSRARGAEQHDVFTWEVDGDDFAYADGVVYLHSGPTGTKQALVKRRPQVCITFCHGHELVWMHEQMACSYSMKSRSVVCRGRVRLVEDMAEKRRALDLMMRHYTAAPCGYSEPAVRNVQVWAVKLDSLSCRSFGLRPSELGGR